MYLPLGIEPSALNAVNWVYSRSTALALNRIAEPARGCNELIHKHCWLSNMLLMLLRSINVVDYFIFDKQIVYIIMKEIVWL